MKFQTRRTTTTCYCNAYKFPHRMGGGKCVSCRHGKNWQGLSAAEEGEGEWCDICAADEGYRQPRSETLSAQERNLDFRRW